MKEGTKLGLGLIFMLIVYIIAGIALYNIGMNFEHEYAWLGFGLWCIFGIIIVVFSIIPMCYFSKHPNHIEEE